MLTSCLKKKKLNKNIDFVSLYDQGSSLYDPFMTKYFYMYKGDIIILTIL